MNDIPQDVNVLLGFINMKLRDEYDSIEELCDDLDLDKDELLKKLSEGGFEYNEAQKKIW